jgi:hypothetical protein
MVRLPIAGVAVFSLDLQRELIEEAVTGRRLQLRARGRCF